MKIGDVVQLKSGGPLMTISDGPENEADDDVVCQWFETSSSAIGEWTFHKDMLTMPKAAPAPRCEADGPGDDEKPTRDKSAWKGFL